ncbi:MAG: alpha/beta hydrolase [Lachnospiraceae bacterium]|nr:alpha/beta hydrolase [Lachnospiraceae bacterium]
MAYVPLPVRPLADSSFIEKKIYDIPYCDQSEAQKLDLYFPNEGEGPFPTIVYFHGGGFFMRDKSDDQVQPFLYLTKYGYAVASCNYRRVGEECYPALGYDTRAATRFLRANAAKYNLDPDRFISAGQSAGGYLSAMLAATGGRPILEDLSQGNADVSSAVQACIAWFGLMDFETSDRQLRENGLETFQFTNIDDSVTNKFFGAKGDEITHEMMTEASPLTYITEQMPPTLAQHGLIDHLVAHQQSEQLVEKIQEICGPDRVKYTLIEEADHDDPLFNTPENVEIMREFLDNVLKK